MGFDGAARNAAERIIGVPYPDDFTWRPMDIYELESGAYATNFNVEKYRNLGEKKIYYVSLTGLSGNSGLSFSAPTTISAAIQKSDIDAIAVLGGLYHKDLGFAGVVPTRDIAIVSVGKVTLSNHDANLVWSATSGQTNVWQAPRTSISNVFDASLISDGGYTKLTLQTSIENVNANPGSYFVDGTNVVFVKTFDQRQPDANIRVYITSQNNSCAGKTTTYLEGISFEGGTTPFRCYPSGGFSPTVVMYNNKFRYCGGATGAGGFANAGGTTYAIKCDARKNDTDGFNYHINSGIIPRFVEIDCEGAYNGLDGDNDNGSTAHDGAIGIRVNGKYHNNKGPNVIDINDGTKTLCVGTEAYNSVATNAVNRVNFSSYGETAIRSKMYLHGVHSHGTSTYDIKMDTYGHTLVRKSEFEIGTNFTISTDILDTY